MVRYSLLRTVLDPLLAVAGPQGLVRLEFLPDAWEYHIRAHAIGRQHFIVPLQRQAAMAGEGDSPPVIPDLEIHEDPDHFTDLRDQLAEYFTGQRNNSNIAQSQCQDFGFNRLCFSFLNS